MSEYYNDQWYDERWWSLSPEQRKVASETVAEVISEADAEMIRQKHAQYGHDWIHYLIDIDPTETPNLAAAGMTTLSAHHGWGTGIRNLLRIQDGANIPDEDLPFAPYEDGTTHRNWDDFYVQAIEAAVGVREV